jgi:hypothetical protein
MFLIGLLTKIVDMIVSQIVDEAGQRLLSGWQDSKKKLGRDLLDFYVGLERYALLATSLAESLEKHHLRNPVGYAWITTTEPTAKKLARVTGELVGKFWPFLTEPYSEELYSEFTGRPPKRQAARRAAVMDVYDRQLLELAKATYRDDMHVIRIVEWISQIHFEHLEMWMYSPIDGDLEPLLAHREIPAEQVRRLSLERYPPDEESLQQVAELIVIIRRNVDAVQELRANLRRAMKEHFSIEDLL